MNVRRVLLTLVAVLAVGVGCGPKTETLNLFIWSEYIDPQIVKDFEREYHCQVSVSLYEDNETLFAKLAGGGTAVYDVIVPTDYTIPGMVKRGFLAPLRHENIPNLRNLDPRFTDPPFDIGLRYSVPYQWGTSGIYLRREKGKPVEETWGLMFDPAKQPGAFLLVNEMRPCIGAALKYKGHSLNSTNRAELQEAAALLVDAKRRSLGFEGTVGGRNRVLSKGAVMAFVSNGDAARGMAEDPETYYFVPKEGGAIWVDNLCVTAQAPHRDLAEKFINYLLEPRVGARLSNFNQYASPNRAALEFVKAADRNNSAIYPPPATLATLEYRRDLGAATAVYDELWTYIKTQ